MTTHASPPQATSTSALALAVGAPGSLHPEPEWIARAADECGWSWARIAWQRAASVPGAWFDSHKADRVVDHWPRWFKLTYGRFAGKPFNLSFWQEVAVRLLVGWKAPVDVIDPDTGLPAQVHVRVFRELRLWIPRKNGKSEFLAALALYFWAIEGLHRGEGYVFASSEDQAAIAFTKMSDMVEYSRDLKKQVTCYAESLWIQELKSPFQLLTGKAKGKHGKAPSVTLGDEMHEWPTRDLASTLRQGEASLEPIRLYASTAGIKSQATGWELWEESLAILDGRQVDPSKLIIIFAAPEEAEWDDESVWPIANPSLGLSPTIQTLREDAAEARRSPTALAAFRRYRLNQWVEEFTRWLKARDWDKCAPDKQAWKRFPEELKGRPCQMGFDSTKNYDFASLCLRFPPVAAGERVKYLWKFWLPADTIAQRVAEENVAFDRWRDAGALIEIPGGVFVLDWAVKAALEAWRDFKVERIGWDSWNALEFYNKLVEAGVPEDRFAEMRFGTKTLGPASKAFERGVLEGSCDHGGNPVARWMALHCHVRFDENMNFVPAKKKSEQSIDGIMAAVMTDALALAPTSNINIDGWLANPVVV